MTMTSNVTAKMSTNKDYGARFVEIGAMFEELKTEIIRIKHSCDDLSNFLLEDYQTGLSARAVSKRINDISSVATEAVFSVTSTQAFVDRISDAMMKDMGVLAKYASVSRQQVVQLQEQLSRPLQVESATNTEDTLLPIPVSILQELREKDEQLRRVSERAAARVGELKEDRSQLKRRVEEQHASILELRAENERLVCLQATDQFLIADLKRQLGQQQGWEEAPSDTLRELEVDRSLEVYDGRDQESDGDGERDLLDSDATIDRHLAQSLRLHANTRHRAEERRAARGGGRYASVITDPALIEGEGYDDEIIRIGRRSYDGELRESSGFNVDANRQRKRTDTGNTVDLSHPQSLSSDDSRGLGEGNRFRDNGSISSATAQCHHSRSPAVHSSSSTSHFHDRDVRFRGVASGLITPVEDNSEPAGGVFGDAASVSALVPQSASRTEPKEKQQQLGSSSNSSCSGESCRNNGSNNRVPVASGLDVRPPLSPRAALTQAEVLDRRRRDRETAQRERKKEELREASLQLYQANFGTAEEHAWCQREVLRLRAELQELVEETPAPLLRNGDDGAASFSASRTRQQHSSSTEEEGRTPYAAAWDHSQQEHQGDGRDNAQEDEEGRGADCRLTSRADDGSDDGEADDDSLGEMNHSAGSGEVERSLDTETSADLIRNYFSSSLLR